MKKLSVLILFFSLIFCFACSSGKSENKEEVNDSDGSEAEIQDSDNSEATDTEPSETDSDNAVTDSDNTDTAPNDGDSETDDSDTAGSGICSPNPCDTAENQAAHQTRCMPENEGTEYSCHCDLNYYLYDGICCQAHSSNKGGKCVCDNYYLELEPGKCVAECTDNTLEGLNGYCKDGKICQQGTCITDHCAGYTCPENSTCTTKNDEAFCQCDNYFQMSNGKCCPQNSTNVNGTCKCNTGYTMSGDECVMSANNPCKTKPCSPAHYSISSKNRCVPDDSETGYHCECNTNYVENTDGSCSPKVYDLCPNSMQCIRKYCVPQDLSNEQCVKNSDCREFGGSAECNPLAAGGICNGCNENSDCPGNTQCNENYHACALMCDSDDDCPYGSCHSIGYCVQKHCSTDADCFSGTICNNSTGDNDGMCQRASCLETACSDTNPGGTCPNANEACINGECVSSCSPNPCHDTNRTKCEIKLGLPTCVCDEGTVEKNGKCQPKTVTSCPSGFVCKNGYCAKTSDPAFFCAENSDCGGSLTCSPKSPSGTCNGCTYTAECPTLGEDDPVSCLAGYCVRGCFTDDDCNPGMTCNTNSQGSFCGSRSCSKPSDCPANYTCTPSSTGSENGTCTRKPCE